MKTPDFKQWAYNITIRTNMTRRTIDEIETALRQAYEQGYHYGLNMGWAEEQEKNIAENNKED